MRYVIYGAGGIGGVLGGRLAQHGREVVLIARGAHLDTLRSSGLVLRDPDGEVHPPVGVVGSPAEVALQPDDIVLLTMKTQDTSAALAELVAVAPPGIAVACAQNGVENERLALRRFAHVHALSVVLPATYLEPGVVQTECAPVTGVLEVGRYPSGSDGVDERLAADLGVASFDVSVHASVMRWKHAKLLSNLGNALEAALGAGARSSGLYRRAREEALSCYRAAGIDWASEEEDRERRSSLSPLRPVGGASRGGGSSWQSLARATGTIETDWLNGEIVLLGRLHGVPTPVNAMLQRVANGMARAGARPASLTAADLEAELSASEPGRPEPGRPKLSVSEPEGPG